MADDRGSSNVAIVALVVVLILVAVGVALYYGGAFGGRGESTTVIEVPVTPPDPPGGDTGGD
jgi:ABC-type transporter Mla subunit MlaD